MYTSIYVHVFIDVSIGDIYTWASVGGPGPAAQPWLGAPGVPGAWLKEAAQASPNYWRRVVAMGDPYMVCIYIYIYIYFFLIHKYVYIYISVRWYRIYIYGIY